MLIEKVRQRTFLYDTKSPDYRDQHMRANACEGIGKVLKIKRKFYVSSRGVRIVCPRKPTGYVMHQQFNIQQLYSLPILYLCVLYLSENKQRLVPLTE